ncbi:hypothetical protein MFIFM68171_01879 [Madurella fahalii]|uniref:RRM domain-containing protein n=1 Tax=Madurella fahalii TaxID=1157608 RepID=A0ABQ0G1W7_9PEZI
MDYPTSYPSLPPRAGCRWGFDTYGRPIPMPNIGFYTSVPADAECILSLNAEVPAKRSLGHRLQIQDRPAELWLDWDVEKAARDFRAEYPREVANIVRPTLWEDLYRYFDAHDLWFKGAWNLWHVIQCLCDENEGIRKQIDPHDLNEIDGWAWRWCTHRENRDRLSTWDQQSDILDLLTQENRNELCGCGSETLDILRRALCYWYHCSSIWGRHQPSGASINAAMDFIPSNDVSAARPACTSALAPTHDAFGRPSSAGPAPARAVTSVHVAPRAATPMPVIAHGTNYGRRASPTPDDAGAALNGTAAARDENNVPAGQIMSRHQRSKSGPVIVDYPLARRRGGIVYPGPSRQPDRGNQLPVVSSQPLRNPRQVQPRLPQKPDSLATQPSPRRDNGPQRQQTRKMCNNRNRSAGVYVYETYDACDCARCTIRSRSVCVNQLARNDLDSRDVCDILKEHFSAWGYVEDCSLVVNNNKAPYAFVQFASEHSALRAVAEANGQPIAHLTTQAKVTHPFFSKYYVAQVPPPRHGTRDHRRYWGNRMLDQTAAVPVRSKPSPQNGKGKAPVTATIYTSPTPPRHSSAELPLRPAFPGSSPPFSMAQPQDFPPNGCSPPQGGPLPALGIQQVQHRGILPAVQMQAAQLPMEQVQDGWSQAVQAQTKPPSEDALLMEVHARSESPASVSSMGSIRVRLPRMSRLRTEAC